MINGYLTHFWICHSFLDKYIYNICKYIPPPPSDENAPLHALKLAVVSEIRRISVKVSGVDTLVGAMRKKSHCISIAEKMMHVQEAFKAYPKDKITDIWGCYFNNLRGIMKETGGNQYKPAHNDSRNRRKETGLPIDLSVNLEDYLSCLDF